MNGAHRVVTTRPASTGSRTSPSRVTLPAPRKVLHAAYREPPTPADHAAHWPDGPPDGGPGGTVRLRNPDISRPAARTSRAGARQGSGSCSRLANGSSERPRLSRTRAGGRLSERLPP